MRRMPWTTYLWPGLPQTWFHGSWPGLALALGAAGVFNVLLVVCFGWSELVGPNLRNSLWAAFAAAWIAAVVWSAGQCLCRAAIGDLKPGQDDFDAALDHYLRGNHYEAEQILESLLRRNVRDLDARLMLATLLRRVGRLDEASRQLDSLVRFEGADKWELEIEEERALLAEAKTRKASAA